MRPILLKCFDFELLLRPFECSLRDSFRSRLLLRFCCLNFTFRKIGPKPVNRFLKCGAIFASFVALYFSDCCLDRSFFPDSKASFVCSRLNAIRQAGSCC